MSAQLTPSKRQHDRSLTEVNGKRKWHKSSALGSDSAPIRGSSARNIIRLLCQASKIGGFIGKGGSNISQICQETGAKVYVEGTVPGCDERVIVITGSDRDTEVGTDQVKDDAKETKAPEACDDPEKQGETDENKQSISVDVSQPEKEKGTSSAQKALLIVLDKMIDGFSGGNAEEEESNKQIVVRLLVFSSQVGCLLGKAGSVIKQMSSESGAQIRILPKDKMPSCASSSDELVQISGRLDTVRKGLQSVCEQLHEISLRDQDSFPANSVGQSSHSFGPPPRHDRFHPSSRYFHGHGAPYPSGFHDGEASLPGRVNFPPDVLTFRLLCSEEKVGGVIGKAGSIVKGLQHESGCDIKVLESGVDKEHRVIVISGPTHPDDGISPPQEAVLRVQSRIYRAAPETKENNMAKLLVYSNQIGCLLGKGGSVISEMRKSTGAFIRILSKDQIPKCAAGDEEVVQVNGEFEVVQAALLLITARLKDYFFRDAFPPLGPPNPAFMDQMPPFPPYMGRREFSPSGTFSNRGPPFNNFDGPGGLPPGGRFPPHDDHPPFVHDFHRPGIPHMSERMPAMPWGPQGPPEGAGPMGFPEYPGAPQRRFGGFAGGNHLAVITSTTVEVVVPSFVVPAIYGEDGGCLRQIHEISEAQINITDSKPGASETVIVIYGTPDQTNAAQSLIQAFVVCETEGH